MIINNKCYKSGAKGDDHVVNFKYCFPLTYCHFFLHIKGG
jgi:hypothetical protein